MFSRISGLLLACFLVGSTLSAQPAAELQVVPHPNDPVLASGLTRYLQDRKAPPGPEQQRYFGGLVRWTFRGVHLDRDVRERRDWLVGRDVSASGALAFGTLERLLGWPALQAALSAAGERTSGGDLSRTDVLGVLNDTTGRDLTWFFDAAFASSGSYDYAVDQLSSVLGSGSDCGGATPCYRTTVVLRRNGDRIFSGTGEASVGGYEAGRALTVLTRFEDGSDATDYWDGRARSKTIEYLSRAQAVSAELDPGRTLLLDANTTNNSQTLKPAAGRAASRWAMTWMMWLQDQLLTYAFLV